MNNVNQTPRNIMSDTTSEGIVKMLFVVSFLNFLTAALFDWSLFAQNGEASDLISLLIFFVLPILVIIQIILLFSKPLKHNLVYGFLVVIINAAMIFWLPNLMRAIIGY